MTAIIRGDRAKRPVTLREMTVTRKKGRLNEQAAQV
jgi:hypothetical protein